MGNKADIVNVAAVRHLSPFRYPGGKTWLVPFVRSWLCKLDVRVRRFVEPFAGGAIVGLTVADEALAERVVLAELDDGVASVWKTVFGRSATWLMNEILQFDMCRESVIARLANRPASEREFAFQTILRNRVQRGGILAPGASLMLNGENGRGVASRWYPQTLARRIEHLRSISHRIEFHHCDAFKIVKRFASDARSVLFIDPPYTAGGKRAGSRLYAHNEVDHPSLFAAAAGAAGPVMLTYDNAREVRQLAARYELTCRAVPMKNAHHEIMRELTITNDNVYRDTHQACAKRLTDELIVRSDKALLFAR